MIGNKRWLVLPAMLAICFCFGCTSGSVSQGKVISYDKADRSMTVIADSSRGKLAKYDVLPPVTVKLPSDPAEMGPTPEAGKLMLVDVAAKRLVVFDAQSGALKSVAYSAVREHTNVFGDDARVAKVTFPIVDREQKTITVYAPQERALVTFSASDEQLAMPVDTWKSGDEVRYYFKQPGQALRLMNVSKTDITKH